ncbi:sensor histidine kinase [Microbispora sp. CA-135349]|uniref:sensor histidine kinase n=1 Tax=Microbispora sp. CA-135349 TaxID=3239953 RepID=UPI003D8F912C
MDCPAVVLPRLRRQHHTDVLPVLSVWAFQAVFAVSAGVPLPLPVLVMADTVASGTLLWRRKRPCTVAAITMACHLTTIVAGHPAWAAPAALCALYAAGRYGAPRRAWITAAAADLAVTVTVQVLAAGTRPPAGTLGAVAAVGLGHLMRLRRELSDRSRAEQAREAVRAERRRIAREMHDVVAHHISTMNLLVGAARTTMTRDPEQAGDTLLTAERTGREAMAEMRRLLHVLRADDAPGEHSAGHSAGHGAAALPDLIARVRDAGLPVEMRVCGDPVELETATDHALYRIVQEALTNVRKHAGGARVSVLIAYTSGQVEVTVRDDGPGAATAGDGFGLAGMAERAAACGGRLRAAPRPEGGFEVHASLPAPATPREKA